jgi:hypothetical protein
MFFERASLMDSIEYKTDEVGGLSVSRTALEGEIRRLQEREKVFSDTLKIMQDDLPTLEVLNALETYMVNGMGLNSLNFTPPQGNNPAIVAQLEATAIEEEQIIELTTGLSECGVFSNVIMPNSRRDDATGRVTFTLSLTVLPIGQISAAR